MTKSYPEYDLDSFFLLICRNLLRKIVFYKEY